MLPIAGCLPTPPTAIGSPAPGGYVLCALDPPISYAAPKPGQVETAANSFDTTATVGRPGERGTIRDHNAVVGAACQ